MKFSPSQQQSIVDLLTRLYFDICAIETPHNLLVGGGDFRPRIEYFHDAVRAFTADNFAILTVERLAYDLKCLHYLQSMPLSAFTPHGGALSPRTDLVAKAPNSLAVKPGRPDRATKEKLAEYYQHYAILFSALLKTAADADLRERTDASFQDAGTLAALAQHFEALAAGKGSLQAIANTIHHLEDDALRQELRAFLEQGKHKKTPEVKKLLASIKTKSKQKDKSARAVESAHMDYCVAQLGIYEEGKDAVKKMAAAGMNLVGQFVESAIQETRREMGR